MLHDIVRSADIEMSIREVVVVILAMHEAEDALSDLMRPKEDGSWYAAEIAVHILEYGSVYPYA